MSSRLDLPLRFASPAAARDERVSRRRRGERVSRRRRGERGSMMVMCLGVIVALLLLATAFLATVMNRRDQNSPRQYTAYAASGLQTAQIVSQYMIDGGRTPFLARWGVPGGLDGFKGGEPNAPSGAGDDDSHPFPQLSFVAAMTAADGGLPVANNDDRTDAMKRLWAAIAPLDANGWSPFMAPFDQQYLKQELGFYMTSGTTPFPLAGYTDQWLATTVAADMRYSQRIALGIVDLSGCLPLGVPHSVAADAKQLERLANILFCWGQISFTLPKSAGGNAEQSARAPGLTTDLALELVKAASQSATLSPIQTATDLIGRVSARKTSPAETWEDYRKRLNLWRTAVQLLEEFCPPPYAVPYTWYDDSATPTATTGPILGRKLVNNAVIYTLMDNDDDGNLRALQRLPRIPPAADPDVNYPYALNPLFLLNANTASIRSLAALHLAVQKEMMVATRTVGFAVDVKATIKALANTAGTVATDSVTTGYPHLPDAIAAVVNPTGAEIAFQGLGGTPDAPDYNGTPTALDAYVKNVFGGEFATAVDDLAGIVGGADLIHPEKACVARARDWAMRLYTVGKDRTLEQLVAANRPFLNHALTLADRTSTTLPTPPNSDSGVASIDGKSGTAGRAPDVTRGDKGGWGDFISEIDLAPPSAPLPTLQATVTLHTVQSGTDETTVKTNSAKPPTLTLSWKGLSAAAAGKKAECVWLPLPYGELLWGMRDPRRYNGGGEIAIPDAGSEAYGDLDDPIPYAEGGSDGLDAGLYKIREASDDTLKKALTVSNAFFKIQVQVKESRCEETTPTTVLPGYPKTVDGLGFSDADGGWDDAKWPGTDVKGKTQVSTMAARLGLALLTFQGNLYQGLKNKYAPPARLFVNRGGAAYRVLARGRLYDEWQQKNVGAESAEFVYVPHYNLTAFNGYDKNAFKGTTGGNAAFAAEFPAILEGTPAKPAPAYQPLPALGRVVYQRSLRP